MLAQIWMLTGDKLETALCIARSLQLGGGAGWHCAAAERACTSRHHAYVLLQQLTTAPDDMDLIIEGETLEVSRSCTRMCANYDPFVLDLQ